MNLKAYSSTLQNADNSITDRENSRPHLSNSGICPQICMESDMMTVRSNIKSPGTEKFSPIAASDKQWRSSFLVKLPTVGDAVEAGGIAYVVERSVEAIATEEKDVHPTIFTSSARNTNEARGFHKGSIGIAAVENLDGLRSFWSDAITLHLLQHKESISKGRHAVIAVAAVANTIAINLVDKVLTTIEILEASRVDSTTLATRKV